MFDAILHRRIRKLASPFYAAWCDALTRRAHQRSSSRPRDSATETGGCSVSDGSLSHHSRKLYDARDLGKENILIDYDVPIGVDFVEHIDREVQKAGVLFAVIGPRWLGAWLDDSNDFVRIEIASALRRTIPVVPILVDGAQMPRADQLPDEIKPLAHVNAS